MNTLKLLKILKINHENIKPLTINRNSIIVLGLHIQSVGRGSSFPCESCAGLLNRTICGYYSCIITGSYLKIIRDV